MDSKHAGVGTQKDILASVEKYHQTIYKILTKHRKTMGSGDIGGSINAFVAAVVMASAAMEAARNIMIDEGLTSVAPISVAKQTDTVFDETGKLMANVLRGIARQKGASDD